MQDWVLLLFQGGRSLPKPSAVLGLRGLAECTGLLVVNSVPDSWREKRDFKNPTLSPEAGITDLRSVRRHQSNKSQMAASWHQALEKTPSSSDVVCSHLLHRQAVIDSLESINTQGTRKTRRKAWAGGGGRREKVNVSLAPSLLQSAVRYNLWTSGRR